MQSEPDPSGLMRQSWSQAPAVNIIGGVGYDRENYIKRMGRKDDGRG